MDEIACREEVWQGWVPLYLYGRTREEAGPTVPLRRNCEVGKNWGRSGSHCETRDEFACREEVWQGLVPLGMN